MCYEILNSSHLRSKKFRDMQYKQRVVWRVGGLVVSTAAFPEVLLNKNMSRTVRTNTDTHSVHTHVQHKAETTTAYRETGS